MTAKKSESTAPAVVEEPRVPAMPSFMGDMAQYAGAGISDRVEDFTMPFLAIAQKGSPQVQRRDPKYIDGCETGMIFNTATQDLWQGEGDDAGVRLSPAAMRLYQVEWVPRTEGGGYVATHPIDTPLLRQARNVDGRMVLPNGNQLVETAYYYCVLEKTLESVVVGFSSTALGAHRNWQTLMSRNKIRSATGELIRAPGFSHLFQLTTSFEKNDKGDWFTWRIRDIGWLTAEHADLYDAAKQLNSVIMAPTFRMGRPVHDGAADGQAPVDGDMPI